MALRAAAVRQRGGHALGGERRALARLPRSLGVGVPPTRATAALFAEAHLPEEDESALKAVLPPPRLPPREGGEGGGKGGALEKGGVYPPGFSRVVQLPTLVRIAFSINNFKFF